MRCLGTWYSGGLGSVRFMVGLNDLKELSTLSLSKRTPRGDLITVSEDLHREKIAGTEELFQAAKKS
ncbi:hypothetical protein QYF61_026699, partial [Mycteria americana]